MNDNNLGQILDAVSSSKRELSSSSSLESLKNSLLWTSSEFSDFDEDGNLPEKRSRIIDFMESTLLQYSDEEFRQHFRLCRHVMDYVEQLIKSAFEVSDQHYGGRPAVTAKKGIHFFVWYLANQETFRQICDRLNLSPSTGYDIIKKVSLKFKSISQQYIKFPQPDTYESYAKAFKKRKGLSEVIGAIDGSHIPIRKPKEDGADFVNRKGFHSVLLQAVCNSNKIFIDIYVGEPGSLHDPRVLRKSLLYKHIEENPVTLGQYCLLGDSAYPALPWLVPPYKDTGNLTHEQSQFNYAHSATTVIIENAFGLLKGRFRRLRHFDNLKMDIIINYIISACVLHNICLELNDQIDIAPNSPDDDEVVENRDLVCNQTTEETIGEERRQQIFNKFFLEQV